MKLPMPRVLVLVLTILLAVSPLSLHRNPVSGIRVAGLEALAAGTAESGSAERAVRAAGSYEVADLWQTVKRHGRAAKRAAGRAADGAGKVVKRAGRATRRAGAAVASGAADAAGAVVEAGEEVGRKLKPLKRSIRVAAARASGWVSEMASSLMAGGRKLARAPDEIVTTGLSDTQLARLIERGFTPRSESGRGLGVKVRRLGVPKGMEPEEAQRIVVAENSSANVADNHYYYPEGDTAQVPAELCVGEGCAGATLVGWAHDRAAACGELPVIGLVDTAVDIDNPALVGQAVELVPARPEGADPSTTTHGTTVAALLVGRADSAAPGLLPNARLVAADAFYQQGGTGDRTDVATLITALEALLEHGATVINLSLSGPPNPVLEEAVRALNERGVVVVAAAGNGGPGAEPSYPAGYAETIAVTAVDRNLDIYNRATRGDFVDIAAPGVNLWTAPSIEDHKLRSGTSFAVPFVTAAAAVLASGNPSISPTEVDEALEAGARDLGDPGRDPVFGAGLLQAKDLCDGAGRPGVRVARGGKFVPSGQ